ncbi:MAG: NADH-quinone oxidoreductase subunit L [Planctomycetes bacterium]|nr:NADH-quinone oxidoreductase subunit L [Planctomycetota bacterium]MCL4730603.1 NADH-quinone oxidoreductase subunit L [Planctomycetota bacterium]
MNLPLEFWLFAVPLLPLVGFLINGFFGRNLAPQTSGAIAASSVACAFLIAVGLFVGPLQKAEIHAQSIGWMATAGLNINLGLYLDELSGLYMLIITGIGALIHVYSIGYMSHDEGHWRYFAYLNLFVFSMLMLVLGDSLLTMFLGWEGVGLCSYLLIGFWYKDLKNTNAGMKAFIVNRVGDFGFMVGMFLIFWHFGTLSYAGPDGLFMSMRHAAAAGNIDHSLLNWAGLCLFVGACGKSAQIPLYVWLPDAMAGPTPVSALIHAATMVTAGIYMLARMNFVYVHAEHAMTVIAIVGASTALFAGTIGLVQRDIKKVLAYSTVSQLGFMFLAAGLGQFGLAVFHVFTHAFFKALLFLGSGSVIHSLEHTLGHGNPDSQDIWKMGGLKKKMPVTCWTMFIGCLALAGIPLTSGFFSKDAILFSAMHRGDSLGMVLYGMGLAGALCTAFYTFRMFSLTFLGNWRGNEAAYAHADESPASMSVPLVILAVFALFAGFLWLPPAFHTLGIHSNSLESWLAPIWVHGQLAMPADSLLRIPTSHDEAAIAAEWMNIGISSVVAVVMSFFGFAVYSKAGNLEKVKSLAIRDGRPTFLYGMLLNKYYVDELYDLVIVRPLKVISEVLFLVVDVVIIDLICVSGSAALVKAGSDLGRRIQTGFVRHYLYAFAVGAIVLTAVFLVIAQRRP